MKSKRERMVKELTEIFGDNITMNIDFISCGGGAISVLDVASDKHINIKAEHGLCTNVTILHAFLAANNGWCKPDIQDIPVVETKEVEPTAEQILDTSGIRTRLMYEIDKSKFARERDFDYEYDQYVTMDCEHSAKRLGPELVTLISTVQMLAGSGKVAIDMDNLLLELAGVKPVVRYSPDGKILDERGDKIEEGE